MGTMHRPFCFIYRQKTFGIDFQVHQSSIRLHLRNMNNRPTKWMFACFQGQGFNDASQNSGQAWMMIKYRVKKKKKKYIYKYIYTKKIKMVKLYYKATSVVIQIVETKFFFKGLFFFFFTIPYCTFFTIRKTTNILQCSWMDPRHFLKVLDLASFQKSCKGIMQGDEGWTNYGRAPTW